MVNGAHVLLYSTNPDADRAFFRDVLRFPHVDVGHGWLIFKLPPSEVAVHPANGVTGPAHAGHAMIGAVLYLMCDDLRATLSTNKLTHTEIEQENWGLRTTIKLPSGSELGLYQPSHATAIALA